MQHLRDKGVSTKQRQIVNILSTMLNELINSNVYPIQDVRIANCKCQSPSSFIFNTEIRQPKEYLLERARKENLTYPSVGTPDHKEAFQRLLCMCKAPVSVRRSFFQSTCFFFLFCFVFFFNLKKIRQFLRKILLHPCFI